VIEVTDEMRAAFRADRDDWCDEIGCGRDDCLTERLAAVLAIVERDRCLAPAGHVWHPLTEQAVKVKWVCRKCGGPLNQCETCKEPSLCGEAWCSEHMPDGTWS
jgi:hypothetical protein